VFPEYIEYFKYKNEERRGKTGLMVKIFDTILSEVNLCDNKNIKYFLL